MNLETVVALIKIRNFSPAELARRSGISRQTVTAWKQKALKQGNPYINLFSETQKRVAQALGVSNEDLDRSIEVISDPKKRQILEAELLWDKLFENVESFSGAVVRGHPAALARLVQVYGLYGAARLAGKQVWLKFPRYKNKIHPAYRKQLEIVWMLEQNQT